MVTFNQGSGGPVTTSVLLYMILIMGLYAERLVELVVSRRNIRRLLADGAREYGRSHFPVMALFHTLFPAAAVVEVLVLHRPFPGTLGYISLAIVLLAQALRWWAVRTLGSAWSVRVVVQPDAKPVTGGPYRLLKHPNYLAVILEVAAVPLVHGAWVTAIVATVVNLGLLWVRIPLEEKAMGPGYAAAFARGRAVPKKGQP
jgi:methyltransferase